MRRYLHNCQTLLTSTRKRMEMNAGNRRMKKPKKELAPISQPNGLSETIADQTQLDRLCKGFVDSAYYRKAMADPGYLARAGHFRLSDRSGIRSGDSG
ncbi:hypothetical protein QNI16_36015 [Cytophagaceae bacterium YF14B1]|uniref:Uncharacterized protein n=1 Tax=Xanthocytophaga flava TaxID=3048013 RepID=A0AAE3UCX1_9BACT|nr:hypothetical protein [Xanthocytophaga flavus]MDJ1485943.1 hypothetical protein [Xanthocytophaga flavus]